jgi:hypothetical protein
MRIDLVRLFERSLLDGPVGGFLPVQLLSLLLLNALRRVQGISSDVIDGLRIAWRGLRGWHSGG